MVLDEGTDQDWARVADADPVEREAQMEARYNDLAGVTEEERRTKLKAMARAEYGLSDEKLRPFTISRMRVWLTLPPENAALISASYDAVMQDLPATMAMRRVALVQSLVSDFSPEDEARLRELAPKVFAGAPGRLTGLERRESSLQSEDRRSKKAWWAFWQKG